MVLRSSFATRDTRPDSTKGTYCGCTNKEQGLGWGTTGLLCVGSTYSLRKWTFTPRPPRFPWFIFKLMKKSTRQTMSPVSTRVERTSEALPRVAVPHLYVYLSRTSVYLSHIVLPVDFAASSCHLSCFPSLVLAAWATQESMLTLTLWQDVNSLLCTRVPFLHAGTKRKRCKLY